MGLLDKAIVKALEGALESRKKEREANETIKRIRQIEKPYAEFNAYNISHEVIYHWGKSLGPLTMEKLIDIQHKQSVPSTAEIEVWTSGGFGDGDDKTIKFTWPDPNNIPPKENK